MNVIDEFVAKFQQGRDQWEQFKDYAIETCQTLLRNIETPGIVTGRVKTAESLRKKLIARNTQKEYPSEISIFKDRLDFVGLRIALYFPSQKQDVFNNLQEIFDYESLRPFNRNWKPHEPGIYQNLFGQYVADHLWVSLNTKDQGPAGLYGKQPFEIQLRSVLMDAWAGISHDLQYKALSGHLTGTELKLLDALKGHVEVGELMLEQLYQVHRKRLDTEKEPILTTRDLRDAILDSIPGDQASRFSLGDLDALLLVLQSLGCANPHTVRVLLHQFTNTNLQSHLSAFEHDFEPMPGTLVAFLLEKLLPHVHTQSESFLQVAQVIKARQGRSLHDSRYWHSLLWLSHQFLDRADSLKVFPSGSQVRQYAYIWCTEHHHRPPTSRSRSDSNLIHCLSNNHDHSSRGVEFLAELSFLGLGPTLPQYMEVHDTDYQDNRFDLMAQVLLLVYEKHSADWIQAVCDYSMSLPEVDVAKEYHFFHLADVVTWLMSIRARELLASLLDGWPLHERSNVWERPSLKRVLEAADQLPSGALSQFMRGTKEGFHMLRIARSDTCDGKEAVMN